MPPPVPLVTLKGATEASVRGDGRLAASRTCRRAVGVVLPRPTDDEKLLTAVKALTLASSGMLVESRASFSRPLMMAAPSCVCEAGAKAAELRPSRRSAFRLLTSPEFETEKVFTPLKVWAALLVAMLVERRRSEMVPVEMLAALV
jgi:hypothetical protein